MRLDEAFRATESRAHVHVETSTHPPPSRSRSAPILVYPLAYPPLPLLLGQGGDEFAAEVGD
ncbi:MAG TPA: hypothetical protein VK902_04650, partial [Rubrobacter sp.]|nr:hypothetical protein [Rubrobacter sp.]